MTNLARTARPSLVAGTTDADLAATILRVTMGIFFLAHGWLKLAIFTPAGYAFLSDWPVIPMRHSICCLTAPV